MKKVLVLLFSILVLNSCKNNEETTVNEPQEITADFIYFEDAAVLKGSNFIYGVKLDDKAKELASKVAPVKEEEFDMVPVVIKGIINKKEENQEGWEEIVTITEIIKVSNRPSAADVKLQ